MGEAYMNRTPISNPFDEDERLGRRPIFWFVLGLGVLCIFSFFAGAIYLYKPDPQALIDQMFPSPTGTATRTPTATATSSPTPTITLTATPDIVLTSISEMEPAFKDDFSSNQYKWMPHFNNNKVLVENGLLSLRSNETGYIGIATCSSCPQTGNSFYFQGDVSLQENKNESFGLAFCIQGDYSYYTFSINPKVRRYDFFKHSANGWETLVRNESAHAIKGSPDSNTLGVFFDRGEITLYINNMSVYSYTGETPYQCGQFGFFVHGGGFDMLADDVEIYKIPVKLSPSPTP
jgi:hypothetical protein